MGIKFKNISPDRFIV